MNEQSQTQSLQTTDKGSTLPPAEQQSASELTYATQTYSADEFDARDGEPSSFTVEPGPDFATFAEAEKYARQHSYSRHHYVNIFVRQEVGPAVQIFEGEKIFADNRTDAEKAADNILEAHRAAMETAAPAAPAAPGIPLPSFFADIERQAALQREQQATANRRAELVQIVCALIEGVHASPKQPHNAVMLARDVLAAIDLAMLDGEGEKAVAA